MGKAHEKHKDNKTDNFNVSEKISSKPDNLPDANLLINFEVILLLTIIFSLY